MYQFYIIVILAVVGCVAPLFALAQEQDKDQAELQSVSVKEAITYAITTNPDLQSFARNIDLADEDIDLAKSNYRPNVNVVGDIVHIQSDNDLAEDWQSETGKSITLNLEQSLYRGGQTEAAVNEQQTLKKATESQLDTLIQNTVIDVVEAYMATYRALQAMRVNEENVSLLEEQRKATQARFEAGELTRTDTSQAGARLAEAKADLAQNKALYEVALASLQEVTGLTEIPALIYPNVDENLLPLTIDEALKLGLINNPEVSAAEAQIIAQKYNIEGQEGAFLPQVSAGAGLGYERNPTFSQFESQETATVSLSATIPLYQQGVLRNQLRQSKIRKNQAEDDLAAVKRSVTSAIISAWEEYRAVSSQISARQAQLDSSKIAYEGVRLEEEVGARSILDVLDANQDIREAELSLIDAERDRVNAYYRLLEAIGLLDERLWDNS